MTIWQVFTIATIGAAVATALMGVGLAAIVWLYPPAHSALLGFVGIDPDRGSSAWAAIAVVLGANAAAYSLVQGQQPLAGYMVRRELAKLARAYEEIEATLGTERAKEYVRLKMGQDAAPKLDIFG